MNLGKQYCHVDKPFFLGGVTYSCVSTTGDLGTTLTTVVPNVIGSNGSLIGLHVG